MTTITITLPDESIGRLREIAKRYSMKEEDLLRVGVEDFLSLPDEEFRRATNYVLTKNSELYRRLA